MNATTAPKILLIGGTGRSGTNITKEVLAMHSRVFALPFEYRLTIDPDGLVDFYNSFSSTWSPYLADRKIKRLEKFLLSLDKGGKKKSVGSYSGWKLGNFFPRYRMHVKNLFNSLVDFRYSAIWVGSGEKEPMVYAEPKGKEELAAILGQFLEGLVRDCLAKNKRDIFVEDNTWNILFAKELLELLPNAKLLHIYRDPRDVVASLTKQRWAPTKVSEAAQWYDGVMSKWQQVKKTLPRKRFLELSLEEMVARPNSTLRRICKFAEIDFQDKLLTIDLTKANSGRWKTDINKDELGAARPFIKKWVEQLGYNW
jgi:hypothetical protein